MHGSWTSLRNGEKDLAWLLGKHILLVGVGETTSRMAEGATAAGASVRVVEWTADLKAIANADDIRCPRLAGVHSDVWRMNNRDRLASVPVLG